MLALFREARIVHDERFDRRQFAIELLRQSRPHLGVRPWRDAHRLLQPLPHCLDLRGLVDESRRHRLHALTLTVEKKTSDVRAHRSSTLGPPHPVDHRVDEAAQLAIQPIDLSSIHINGRSHYRIVRKKVTRWY